MKMKILFVHKQILFPRDTGGKIRVLNVLQHLAKRHDVTYACNLRRGEEQHLPQMTDLGLRMLPVSAEAAPRGSLKFYGTAAANLLSRRPFSVNRNFDPALRSRLSELLRAETFDLLICDSVQMARHTMGLGAEVNLLFQHNVEAQILQRHAEVGEGFLKRSYMRSEWGKMQKFEGECGRHFEAVIAVSEQDRKIFEKTYGWKHVHVIDTAVDTEFFQADSSREIADRVVFVGSMDWMPNQDGVKFFTREIWPRIRAARPKATFEIVGRNPPPEIVALATTPGVEVTGAVPDVRPHLSQAAVVVVPLLVGGGTRLKIYEAMAMGRAVVSTTIGAEGLPLTVGKHFFQADDPEAFVAAVIRLLSDPSERARLGESADRFVREHYSSEVVARQFEGICASVLNRHRGRISNKHPLHAPTA
jgi:sugar transferase (PEP-CTERM/EpsH1 system associated)